MAYTRIYDRIGEDDWEYLDKQASKFRDQLEARGDADLVADLAEAPGNTIPAIILNRLWVLFSFGKRNGAKAPDFQSLIQRYPSYSDAITEAYFTLPIDQRSPFEIGQYVLREPIYRGGEAWVFRAFDPAKEGFYALKWTDRPEDIARLKKQALLLEGIESKNVVRVFDHRQVDGRYFIAMPYLGGENLADKIRSVRLSEDQIVDTFFQAATGVADLHEKGIVHGDISPGNIHLGSDGNIRIIDLGLACGIVNGQYPSDAVQIEGGTTPYMPPERLSQEIQDTGFPGDIYSLGASLFHSLVGEHPPPACDGNGQLRREHTLEVVDALSGLRGRHARYLSATCLKAMALDPKQRHESARNFANDVKRFTLDTKRARSLLTRLGVLLTVGLVASVISVVAAGYFDRWLATTQPMAARALTVDQLPTIDSSDFEVYPDYAAWSPTDPLNTATYTLHVRVPTASKSMLIDTLEYRIGDHDWLKFAHGQQPGEWNGAITAKDVTDGVTVNLWVNRRSGPEREKQVLSFDLTREAAKLLGRRDRHAIGRKPSQSGLKEAPACGELIRNFADVITRSSRECKLGLRLNR